MRIQTKMERQHSLQRRQELECKLENLTDPTLIDHMTEAEAAPYLLHKPRATKHRKFLKFRTNKKTY